MQPTLAAPAYLDATWLDRYLGLLGLGPGPPSVDYLRELTQAHVLCVPFENVTSILRRADAGEARVPPLDREVELQAWSARRGGGVCFEVADMFEMLLSGMGFQTHIVLATVTFPGAHQGCLVTIGETAYLVDAGNGAPFFEPIPIPAPNAPVEISQSGLAYRFRSEPRQPGFVYQDRWIEGEWRQFCAYDLAPADENVRQAAYQRHHLRGQSWVVDNLTLIRCTHSDVWSLRDNHLTHYSNAGKTAREIDSVAELCSVAADVFGLPNAPIAAAVRALG